MFNEFLIDFKNTLLLFTVILFFIFPLFITLLMVIYKFMELKVYHHKERIDMVNYSKKRRLDMSIINRTNKQFTKEDILSLIDENMLKRVSEDTYNKVINDLEVQKTKQQMFRENERFKLERAERRMNLDIDKIERKFGFICDQAVQDYVLSHYMKQGEDFKYVVDFGNTEETGRTRKQDIDEIYTRVREIINDDMFFDDLSLIYDLNNYNMEEYLKEHYIKGLYNQLVDDLINLQRRNRILEHQRQAKIMYETQLAEERYNSPEAVAERQREEERIRLKMEADARAKAMREGNYKSKYDVNENETMIEQTARLLEKYKDKPYLHDMIRKEVKKAFKEKGADENVLYYPLSKAIEYGVKGHEIDSEDSSLVQYIKETEDELNDMYYRLLPKEIIDKYKISDEPYENHMTRFGEVRERKMNLIKEMKTNKEFQERVKKAKYDNTIDNKSSYNLNEYLYRTEDNNTENDTHNDIDMNYGDEVTFNIGGQ